MGGSIWISSRNSQLVCTATRTLRYKERFCRPSKEGSTSGGGDNKYEALLAGQLVHRFKSIEQIRFCNSGAETNMMALALAKAYTKRSKVLVFRNRYHGSTLTFNEIENPINLPHDFIVAEYNDI